MDGIFGPDEHFDPLEEEVKRAIAIAEEYLQIIKIK